jgi:NitT/TauT family transport system substrate-binding protein
MSKKSSPVHPSRRSVLKASMALGSLAMTVPLFAQPSVQKPKRKVVIAYGVPTLDSMASVFFSSIPIGAGFFAEEGLDVEIQPMNGASAAISVLAAGGAQFATHSSGALLPAVGRGVPMKAFIVQIPDSFSSIAVLDDGPVKKIEDLKGKMIGVAALTGAPTLVIKSVLTRMGWDVAKDVQWLAVGTGTPALDALRRGRIDALGLWMTPYALFEFHGAKFRYFRPEPLPSVGFTHTTNALESIIEKDPELVAAMSRALAKSLVFMLAAQPDELTKLHFKTYPAAKPVSLSDDDLFRLQRSSLAAAIQYMRTKERFETRREKLGDESDERIAELAKVLYEGGEIPAVLPPDRYFTRQFIPMMNAINFDAVIEQARGFRA